MKTFTTLLTTIILILLTNSHSAQAEDDFLKLPRDQRCQNAGGLVAGHGAPVVDLHSKSESFPAGPIDCTCGGKRFNPLKEGDTCRDGKILTAMERYCQDSKGILTISKTNAKPWPVETKKCLCGEKEFTPTKLTACAAGQVSQKN